MLEIILITLAVGVLIGAVNGLLITRLNVAPFIATLGTLYVARGFALLSSDGAHVSEPCRQRRARHDRLSISRRGLILGIPVSIWLLIIVGCAAAYIAARTPLGRLIYAVGGNERAAALSGVRVNRVKMFVYMFSGFCAAIVGLIISSRACGGSSRDG